MVNMIEANPQLAKFQPTEVLSSLLSDSGDRPELRRTISDNSSKLIPDVEQLYIANGKSPRPDGQGRGSVSGDHEEFVQKTTYTFIPEDPRAYYRQLVEACLKGQKHESLEEDNAEVSLLATTTRALLNECADRWRVHPAARVSILLDVVRHMYNNQELGIEDINEAFALADHQDYSLWPNADVINFLSNIDALETLIVAGVSHCARNVTPRFVRSSSKSV